jgi:hypothetical protein
VFKDGRRTEWFTFAGAKTNEQLAAHFARINAFPSQPGDLSILFPADTPLQPIEAAVSSTSAEAVVQQAQFDPKAVEALKFHECLPPSLRQEVLRNRFVNERLMAETLSASTHRVFFGG